VRVHDQKSQKRAVAFTASLPKISDSSDAQGLRSRRSWQHSCSMS